MANTPQIDVPELSGVEGLQWYLADQTATGDTITTMIKGKASYGTLFNNEIFNALREERVGTYGWYAGHNVRHGYGRQYDEVDLTAIELNVNYNKNGYYSRFEATARTESRPLEEKKDAINVGKTTDDETYLVWWNHDVRALSTKSDIEAPEQGLLKTVTKLSQGVAPGLISDDDYYWAKTNQALKKGEKVFMDARFPGVQSYGVGALQVKEIIYARTEQIVQNQCAAVGYLASPIDSAGNYYDEDRFGTDATKWLVTSASYKKRLGWYEAEMTYAYAKGGWLSVDAEAGKSGVYPRYYG